MLDFHAVAIFRCTVKYKSDKTKNGKLTVWLMISQGPLKGVVLRENYNQQKEMLNLLS